LVLTNYHVIEGATRITVQVNDSATYTGEVQGVDALRDLAVLRICCGSFQALPLGNATALRAGSEVVAIGYPLGLSGSATVTRGIISATRYDSASLRWLIQTDSAINPGNSGGPLFSSTGEVIGINTIKVEQTQDGRPTEGLGFAISQVTFQAQLSTLKQRTYVASPTPTLAPLWQSIQNTRYNYSLKVPSSWTIDYGEYPEVSVEESNGYASAYIYAVEDYGRNLDEVAAKIIDFRKSEPAYSFELISTYKRTLSSGLRVVYVEYRTQGSADFCVQSVTEMLVVVGSRTYGIIGSVCEHSLGEQDSLRFDILDSLTIGNSTPAPTPTPYVAPSPTPRASSTPPHIVLGTVTVNGIYAPAGTIITAWSDGIALANVAVRSNGGYGPLLMPQGAGSTISFTIGNLQARQLIFWEKGGADVLNLTAP
jgi:hypothetical protein